MDKILHQLPASALSEPAFSLIEFLFVTVGCRIGWLKYRSTGSRQKLYSANLEPVHTALDYLFEVSVCHKVPKIANRAREIVAELLGSRLSPSRIILHSTVLIYVHSANQDALYSWFVKRCLSNCDDSQHLALLSSILQARSEVSCHGEYLHQTMTHSSYSRCYLLPLYPALLERRFESSPMTYSVLVHLV